MVKGKFGKTSKNSHNMTMVVVTCFLCFLVDGVIKLSNLAVSLHDQKIHHKNLNIRTKRAFKVKYGKSKHFFLLYLVFGVRFSCTKKSSI